MNCDSAHRKMISIRERESVHASGIGTNVMVMARA